MERLPKEDRKTVRRIATRTIRAGGNLYWRLAVAFADPQSLTINAVANTLPRTSSGISSGTFSKDDGTVKEIVSHSYGKRTRHSLRVDFQKIAPNPLISAQNILYSMSSYIVVDVPVTGFTIVEQKQIVDALTGYLTASSGSKVTQLLGGES